MHELAIAESALEVAQRRAGGRHVQRVGLQLGVELGELTPTALELCFELLAVGTSLEGATLVIERGAAAGYCRDCGARCLQRKAPTLCAVCGGAAVAPRAGVLWVETLEPAEERG